MLPKIQDKIIRTLVFLGRTNDCEVKVRKSTNGSCVMWKKDGEKVDFTVFNHITRADYDRLINLANTRIDTFYGKERDVEFFTKTINGNQITFVMRRFQRTCQVFLNTNKKNFLEMYVDGTSLSQIESEQCLLGTISFFTASCAISHSRLISLEMKEIAIKSFCYR